MSMLIGYFRASNAILPSCSGFTDAFTGVDVSPLPNGWTQHQDSGFPGGTVERLSNKASLAATGGAPDFVYCWQDVGEDCSTDIFAECDISDLSAGVSGPMARGDGTATAYLVQVDANLGTVELFKVVGETRTSLSSAVSAAGTVKLECIGTAIKVYVDDVEEISITNSDISSGQYVGFLLAGDELDEATADNFDSGDPA